MINKIELLLNMELYKMANSLKTNRKCFYSYNMESLITRFTIMIPNNKTTSKYIKLKILIYVVSSFSIEKNKGMNKITLKKR